MAKIINSMRKVGLLRMLVKLWIISVNRLVSLSVITDLDFGRKRAAMKKLNAAINITVIATEVGGNSSE